MIMYDTLVIPAFSGNKTSAILATVEILETINWNKSLVHKTAILEYIHLIGVTTVLLEHIIVLKSLVLSSTLISKNLGPITLVSV